MTRQLIDVGGYRLAADIIGASSPALVYISGLTGDESEWRGVRDAVRSPSAQVTYGRPALGGSDHLPPTLAAIPRAPSWAAAQLHILLDQAAVPSPRILVGHSIGGLVAEAYAAHWPTEVAALVLVDPTHPRMDIDHFRELTQTDHETGGIRFDMQASEDERHRFLPLAAPAVVLSASVGSWLRLETPASELPLPLIELDRIWQQYQRDWVVRTKAVHVVAQEAGHCVHLEAPELVARILEAVVRAVRGGGSVLIDEAIVTGARGRLVDRRRCES